MECSVCLKSFTSNYKHKKTCSKKCSAALKKANRKKWVSENYESFLEYRKKYYLEKDIDKVRERTKRYRSSEEGKRSRREQQKRRLARDPLYKAKRALRKRLWEYKVRFGTISMSKHIGCSWDKFKLHIESKFYKRNNGELMTWDNYGKWHIDHIKPLCSAKSIKDLIKLSHYTNLQPLWAEDNLSKSLDDLNFKSDSNINNKQEEKYET